MRSRTVLAALVVMAVVLLSSGTSQALKMHNFECGQCHKSGVSWTSVDTGNLCLGCHNSAPTAQNMIDTLDCSWDGTQVVCNTITDPDSPVAPTSGWDVGDASNELDSNPSPGDEISHNWGAPINNPRAGSANHPADPMYNNLTASRQGSSGYVTCFRCHDPHGAKADSGSDPTTNKLLRLPGYDKSVPATMSPTPATVESTCVVCHADWAQVTQAENGLESHPLISNYSTFVDNVKYQDFDANKNSAGMALLNGGTDMGCTTCHGVHFSDSDSTTDETLAAAGAGDGALLKGDGVLRDQSGLCQSCHMYTPHPGGNAIGCLVCHSGHSYNEGNPNYYLLRNEVASLEAAGVTQLSGMPGPMTGMDQYTSLPSDKAATWGGTQTGVVDGYCETCHGDVEDAGFSAGRAHVSGEDCTQCHNHSDTFKGAGCNTCHGFAPETDTPGDPASTTGETGYAYVNATNNYASISGGAIFKDESLTPHASHAADSSNFGYTFSCERCHNSKINDFATTHNTGTAGAGYTDATYQNVLESVYTFTFQSTDLATGGVLTSPYGGDYYDPATANCTVYCHSNGGTYTGSPKVEADFTFTEVNWVGTKNSIIGQPGECSSCHGNSVATMGVSQKDNSQTHNAHLNRGYTCNVCHNQTATSNTSVDIASGQHVDGQVDLDLDNTFELSVGNPVGGGALSGASCSVYCHSDGQGTNSSPDWADPASGTCGTCHFVTGSDLPDSHARHLSDADGPQISDCSLCHTHNGEMTTGNDHVNGTLGDVDYNKCQGCHGTNGGTGNDADLTLVEWSNGTATCETCHIGVVSTIPATGTRFTTARTAPAKNSFIAEGHGDTGLTGAPSCTGCHEDVTTNGHFDTVSGADLRLQTIGATTYGAGTETAWCRECHSGVYPHFDNNKTTGGNSIDSHQCYICHEPHGEGVTAGFDAMLLANVGASTTITGFTDRTQASSYYDTTGTNNDGVCQVCHDPAEVSHYNTSGNDGHNSGAVCISCHLHTSNPAFQGGDCFDCHGDGVAEYWPQNAGNDETDDAVTDFNDDGRHTDHMTAIANEVMGQTLADLVTDNSGTGNAPYDTMTSDAKQKEACAYCHTVADGDHASLNSGMAEVFSSGALKIWDGSADADATFAVANHSCATTDCHNSKTTTTTGPIDYSWYGTDTADCIMCHADVTSGATANSTGSTHVAHTDAATQYGINTINCATCHDDATDWAASTNPATGHRDGSWTTDFSYSATYPATGGNCGTNICHNDGTGSGPPVGAVAWATDIIDPNCGICHAEPMASDKHGEHIGNATFLPDVLGGITDRDCDNCHGLNPEEQTTHIDSAVNFGREITDIDLVTGGNQLVTPGGWNGTCANSCHIGDTANDWSTAGVLACADCHDNALTWAPGGNALTRGWPGGTTAVATGNVAHDAHVANTSYVTHSAGNYCVDCHNDNNTNHSTLEGTVTSPTGGNDVTAYTLASGTCTNTCHGGVADFTDSVPSPLCIDCHSSTFIGGNNVAKGFDAIPSTGLHSGTLTVSSNTHDDSFADGNAGTATCETCHTATPSTSHIDGTFTNSWNAVPPSINFDAAVNFTDAATPTCGPNGGLVNCHDDGGAWSRLWSTTAQNSDGSECANCHGTFDQSWVSGISLRHQADADIEANHRGDAPENDCKLCHAYGHTNYTAGMHRDGSIQLNQTNVGFVDNGVTVGCSNCHLDNDGTADGQHEFQDTYTGDADGSTEDRWGRTSITGPEGSCDSCHDANLGGTRHGDATESQATHDTHNSSIYVDSDSNFTAGSPSTYTDCTDCHGHNGSGASHNNGTVNFDGTNIDTTYNYSAAASFGGTCGAPANGCHDNDTTTEWSSGDLGADGCSDCHGSAAATFFEGQLAGLDLTWQASPAGPTTAKHPEHIARSNYVPSNCAECHGANADTGAHATHINKAVDDSVTYASADQTCTNSCHTANTAGDWTTGGSLACSDCHGSVLNLDAGNDPWTAPDTVDGKHGTHAATPSAYGLTGQNATGAYPAGNAVYDFECGECHAGNHLDSTYAAISAGTAVEVTVASWASSTSSCGTNNCHNNGSGGSPNASGNGQLNWGTVWAVADRCAQCHDNWPTTGAHSAHSINIHAEDIYTGSTALMGFGNPDAADPDEMAHGDMSTSTVISCQVCHWETVTIPNNDQGDKCVSCHGSSPTVGGDAIISKRENHIADFGGDTNPDVVFINTTFKTKAQLRNDIRTVPEIVNNWERKNDGVLSWLFYKDTRTFDETTAVLSAGSYNNGAPSTCTTQCHNGNAATWVAPAGDCSICHTELPQ